MILLFQLEYTSLSLLLFELERPRSSISVLLKIMGQLWLKSTTLKQACQRFISFPNLSSPETAIPQIFCTRSVFDRISASSSTISKFPHHHYFSTFHVFFPSTIVLLDATASPPFKISHFQAHRSTSFLILIQQNLCEDYEPAFTFCFSFIKSSFLHLEKTNHLHHCPVLCLFTRFPHHRFRWASLLRRFSKPTTLNRAHTFLDIFPRFYLLQHLIYHLSSITLEFQPSPAFNLINYRHIPHFKSPPKENFFP